MRLNVAVPAWFAAGAFVFVLFLALFAAPRDAAQGDVQRIMYVHVPAAWLAYLAFGVTLACSIAYLVRRDLRFDRIAVASAEVGLVFTGLTIVLGSIWGRATWGKWWDWDPRLTTTAVLFLVYLGYLLLRGSIEDRRRRARLAAVLGIVAFVNVPIVHFSVLLWRGLHQPPTVIRPGDPTIDHGMLAILFASVAAFTLIYVLLVRMRTELERRRDEASTWLANQS